VAVASDAPASLPVADAPEPAPLSLRAFRAVVEKHKLKPSERSVIVDQALLVLEQNYVHLPFKVAMHG